MQKERENLPKQKLNLNEFTESLAGLLTYNENNGETNTLEHRKILKIMKKLLYGELSKRQTECLKMRYCDGMQIKQIAEKLRINKSTASRHVSRAKEKLKKLLEYYT